MTLKEGSFPFEEIRKESGDYFDSLLEMHNAGYSVRQMWSVTLEDHDNGYTFIYGPCDHYINLLGFVATKEKHDGDTVYQEFVETEPDEES